jgi:hypothetical protein
MPFNKGYFQVQMRYYFHCILDCCTGLGTGQDVAGLCVFDKNVILYGGEGNVSVFQSDIVQSGFCSGDLPFAQESSRHPRAIAEVAEPVALRLNVLSGDSAKGFGLCPCAIGDIPEYISQYFQGRFTEPGSQSKICFLSLGLFSLVRIERPVQIVVPACDCCIPEKSGEYELPYTDPCSLFLSMEFPMNEFYPELRKGNCSSSDSCKG